MDDKNITIYNDKINEKNKEIKEIKEKINEIIQK
jgi:hypothetical protein